MDMIPKYDKVLNHSFTYKQTLYRQRFPSQLSGRGPVRGILARYNPAERQEVKSQAVVTCREQSASRKHASTRRLSVGEVLPPGRLYM